MDKKGVTLIELIIVIVLVGVLTIGFGWYIASAIDTWNLISFRSEIVNQARTSFFQMARQIRQAVDIRNDSDQDSLIILHVDGSCIRYRYVGADNELFYDLDSDGSAWDDDAFGSSHVLVDSVHYVDDNPDQHPIFKYYDSSGQEQPPPITPEDIRQIGVEFAVVQREQSYDFRTKVFPRNFRE